MKSLLVFLGLYYSSLTLAQTSPLPDSCNTILWGVVNAKGDTSYLLGTFHEFGNVYFDSYLPINQKYKQANYIAVESVPEGLSFKRPKTIRNWVKGLSKHDKQIINAYLKRTHSAYPLKFARNLPPSLMCYVL